MRLLPCIGVAMALACVCAAGPAVRAQAGRPAAARALSAFDVMEKSIEDLQRAMQAGAITSRMLVEYRKVVEAG